MLPWTSTIFCDHRTKQFLPKVQNYFLSLTEHRKNCFRKPAFNPQDTPLDRERALLTTLTKFSVKFPTTSLSKIEKKILSVLFGKREFFPSKNLLDKKCKQTVCSNTQTGKKPSTKNTFY